MRGKKNEGVAYSTFGYFTIRGHGIRYQPHYSPRKPLGNLAQGLTQFLHKNGPLSKIHLRVSIGAWWHSGFVGWGICVNIDRNWRTSAQLIEKCNCDKFDQSKDIGWPIKVILNMMIAFLQVVVG